MSVNLSSTQYLSVSKSEKYTIVHDQLKGLLHGETDAIANLGNAMALLKQVFSWWWVGLYRVEGEELCLGPFQGPVACSRIAFGKGVCGTAWKQAKTLIVPDVREFPGHIACSAESRSEIVVPIFKDEKVIAVLDVDSENLSQFDADDARELELFCASLVPYL
jgi:GAF domain-containing protein